MTNQQRARVLVLWDVDHTLIETRGVGAELYKAAFEQATGVKMRQRADVTGATEPQIFRETMRLNAQSMDPGVESKYAAALVKQYEDNRNLLRKRGRVLVGASAAIIALSRVRGVVQTVLTGNLKEVANIKLEIFGLAPSLDLDIAAFGEDSAERPDLVAVAQGAAERKYGVGFSRLNSVVVGDSTSDVETGKKGGAWVIAVASGGTSADELREAGANLVIPDLADTALLSAAIQDYVGQHDA